MNKGFTIPELLVAVFVFSLVIGGAANLLLSGIAGQRSSLAMQELLDQSSFVAEYMTRTLRQAQKDLDATCLTEEGLNYEITHNGKGIKFLNNSGQCHEFFLQAGALKEVKGDAAGPYPCPDYCLTSDNIEVQSLSFALKGESQDDNLQPRVSFAATIQGSGLKPETRPQIQLQTTVSQRNVDVLN